MCYYNKKFRGGVCFKVSENGKTAEVMRKILTAKSVTKMFKATKNESALPPVGEYIDELRREKELKKETLFKLSCISTIYGHEIIRGLKNPSRDTLIQFAFALKLTVDETNRLLKIGEKAQLYPMLKRDSLIIFALSHGLNIVQFNISAEESGILPIGNY
jgi:transcriptional regulator with XRE-family HTH domain